MRQAQINVRTRACSRTSIARTKQAALTHNVRGKELKDATELDDFIHSGNEFHRTGATTLKERSPCRLSLLLGTTSNCLSVERNERVTAWVVNISARYCGAILPNDL